MSDEARPDRRMALALAVLYFAALYVSAHTLGYARDEGFYFEAARSYRGWLELLFVDPRAAFLRANVDRYWINNHEHPSLMKLAFSVSHWVLHDRLGWIREPGTAYRVPGMLTAVLGVVVIHAWASRSIGKAAAVVAALAFALMPRVFYHAHLACFDVPVTSLWLTTAYAYFRSLETRRKRWVLLTGVLYGLLLDTKHNAWLLPIALGLHLVLVHGIDLAANRRVARPIVPPALLAMAVIGPLVMYALWPWLWFDPLPRFIEYVKFHLGHEYYNMEFLGRTYWKPPMPAGYAWLMTVATVPFTTLLLAVVGLLAGLALARGGDERAPASAGLAGAFSAHLLWISGMLVAYAPWWSDKTPIFGGTKHWLPAYPFVCLLAGRGFEVVRLGLDAFVRERGRSTRAVAPLAVASVIAPSFAMTVESHPFGLSFYTPLVGGASGAATLGLNRTFWGYTTGSLTHFLNQHAPPNARIYVHDTALQSWDMLRADGRLRADLEPTLWPHESELALYHHEPHMSRVEYQIWIVYGTHVPSAIALYDGVPIAWVYER